MNPNQQNPLSVPTHFSSLGDSSVQNSLNEGLRVQQVQGLSNFTLPITGNSHLEKRGLMALNPTLQDQIQKKVKTNPLTEGRPNIDLLSTTHIVSQPQVNLLNPTMNMLQDQLTRILSNQLQFEIQKWTQIQQINFLMNLKQSIDKPPPIPSSSLFLQSNNPIIPSHQLNFNSIYKVNDDEIAKREVGEIEPPALASITQQFPDWNLATIFSYVKSGKSKNKFEKDRISRKKRKDLIKKKIEESNIDNTTKDNKEQPKEKTETTPTSEAESQRDEGKEDKSSESQDHSLN